MLLFVHNCAVLTSRAWTLLGLDHRPIMVGWVEPHSLVGCSVECINSLVICCSSAPAAWNTLSTPAISVSWLLQKALSIVASLKWLLLLLLLVITIFIIEVHYVGDDDGIDRVTVTPVAVRDCRAAVFVTTHHNRLSVTTKSDAAACKYHASLCLCLFPKISQCTSLHDAVTVVYLLIIVI